MIRLPPAPRTLIAFPDAILGLAPQALCWRPLRGLSEFKILNASRHLMRQVCCCPYNRVEKIFPGQENQYLLPENDFCRQENDFCSRESDFCGSDGGFCNRENDFCSSENDFCRQESSLCAQESDFCGWEGDCHKFENDLRSPRGEFAPTEQLAASENQTSFSVPKMFEALCRQIPNSRVLFDSHGPSVNGLSVYAFAGRELSGAVLNR